MNSIGLDFNNCGGLRYWQPHELEKRDMIERRLTQSVSRTLLAMNQMWTVLKVDAPVMVPRSMVSAEYTDNDIFVLRDGPVKDEEYVLRAETTAGSYAMAVHMLRNGEVKAPLCIYQAGQSFRRELNDGATASRLRFNAFYQLEYQCIYSLTTAAPIAETLREALLLEVKRMMGGRDCRLICSDRLPSYAEETVDIEVHLGDDEWREVASTSLRTDFPEIPGHKFQNRVFEVAFGLDRLVALAA